MNNATITGRLGQDPEVKTYGDNKMLVKFSIATNDGFGDKKKTNWHNCTAFGKPAEIISKYVKKGNEICINGSIDYNEHEGKRYTSINVNNFTLIGGKSESNSSEPTKQEATASDEVEDDLPF